MKKKKEKVLVAGVTIAMLLCSFSACSKKGEATTEQVTEMTTSTTSETSTDANGNFVSTETSYGTKTANVELISELINAKTPFFLYIEGRKDLPFDYETVKNSIKELVDEYGIPIDIYSIDETTLSDEDKKTLATWIGQETKVEDMLVKEEKETKDTSTESNAIDETKEQEQTTEEQNKDYGTTYFGIYAFNEGKLIRSSHKLSFTEENIKYATSLVGSVFFESNLFVNNHDIELITYEEVLKKNAANEKFLLYVGRDTCPYCHAFMPSLESVLKDTELNVPIYYLYTQEYKTAINDEVDGAKDTWEDIKETLGIEYTPSLVIYDQGMDVATFDGYIVGEDYFVASSEEKAAQRTTATNNLKKWLNDKSLTKNAGPQTGGSPSDATEVSSEETSTESTESK